MNIYLSIHINYMMTHLQHDVPAGWIGNNKENFNQTSLTIRMQRKKLYNDILVFERTAISL